ncbi:MAG TPA: Gfo/Idh/MocA family oxidoreductase [Candidatus Hydrogenedentes bacterium]|nr:Gfo/Idh/MocA family oxidoreductase [Candidatus Hydrogenedentota bacterium]
MKTNRRTFLKQVSALSAVPFILPSTIWSAETKPNDRIVMGFIGMGKQNQGLLDAFLHHQRTRVVAVCDVDTTRRVDAQGRVNKFYTDNPDKGSPDCAAYNDFREIIARDDINAVCIATPDHWHAIPTLAALRSGKDVYCEKPLTHNIHEAIEVMHAVKKSKRVLQTGSMQRSSEEFRVACELVRNGAIGKIDHVICSFGPPGIPCDLPEEPMEPGLDWNMWVGPAPMRPYNSILSPRGVHDHFPNWRTYKEFGSGAVGDWGAHHLDIAQWGLGMDDSGPDEVHPPDDPKAASGAVLHYGKRIKVFHDSGFGIHFFGEDGEVKVNRGQFEFWLGGKKIAGFAKREDGGSLGSALSFVQKEYLDNAKIKLYVSKDHLTNFLDCVESRKRPITDEIVGGRSAICCHLVNQAYYNHAVIHWKPKKMRFAKHSGDPKWLTRDYRSPWSV